MKRGLKILLWADAWADFGIGMLGPIYAIFVEDIGGDILDASWAYFAFMITAGLVMYLISRWENHVLHKEKLVVIGYCLTAVGALGYYFVDTQAGLLVVQVILGVSMAVLSPAFDALYSHYVVNKHEASDWGAWEAMGYMVAALAAVVGGYVVDSFGFRPLFLLMFGAALVGAIISFSLFKNKHFLQKL
ncbi:MAG: hypothetical protein COU11_00305 [Candidatus Harrisonbacteria bacterium CG10_big_fil_rev_8_21_14_0_10_49_15]|uniref:Major facilitator superfamily (MFS) profile domain-containing protein n=1 Tax=Candidatus Harrisonbacteria bacterium CG10_big_fil_rev_8_21_14_0_10_49_15 TaxID=1974587 RepID=A0A2H0UP64_9BACT|nr:MAG: hypothetical protein COU11_00305 [Candidatus Harrisonbacteria bacterium CG10_big_fil_rev_8_21_14_0_10_49_15]